MTGDNSESKFEITIRGAWSRGTLKALLYLVLAAAGAGGVAFWDRLASFLVSAPVWVLVALFVCSLTFGSLSAVAVERPYPAYKQSSTLFSSDHWRRMCF